MTRLYDEHAELYDFVFQWDIRDEIQWLLERFGPGCRSVLEPGCGSGRVLDALASAGLEAVGIDTSEAMLALARRRLGDRAQVVRADMTDFDLGRRFDGAVCPINTLGHLTPPELSRHLDSVARHAGRYLVQLALHDGTTRGSTWDVARDGIAVRVSWGLEEVDLGSGVARERSRLEIVEGPGTGNVVEEEHLMTAWTPQTWRAAVDASPFEWTATFDGDLPGRPRLELGATGGLLWHELVARR